MENIHVYTIDIYSKSREGYGAGLRVETFYKFYGATLIAQYEHNVGNTICR